jgi:hypothetical protein
MSEGNYQDRVREEKRELDEKISKLETFIGEGRGEIFRTLAVEECGRLIAQRNAMREYSRILGQRIAAFK